MCRAVPVQVRAVSGRRDQTRFIDLPFALHASQPQWVPPLKIERRLFLNRRLNAFFSHGEAEYFLAVRDGRATGRISAHIDHAFNDHHGQRWGWFGFLELEDDPATATALIGAARSWLAQRGCERMEWSVLDWNEPAIGFYRSLGARQHREWLQVTLDSIGDAVIATDAEGAVTFMNPAAESLTGWGQVVDRQRASAPSPSGSSTAMPKLKTPMAPTA